MSSISALIEPSSSAAVLLGFFMVRVSSRVGLYSMRETEPTKQQLSVCNPDESGLEGHVRRLKSGSLLVCAPGLPPIARITRKAQLDDLEADKRALTAIQTSVRAAPWPLEDGLWSPLGRFGLY